MPSGANANAYRYRDLIAPHVSPVVATRPLSGYNPMMAVAPCCRTPQHRFTVRVSAVKPTLPCKALQVH